VTDFETKDSGERQQWDSGMQRDTQAGKPRFDLIIPEGIPYEDQLLTRFAKLLGRGAEKYDERNWEQANSEAEIARARSSAFRHFMQWFCGERDEDHAVATLFNIMVVETTRQKIDQPGQDDTDYAGIADEILGNKPDEIVIVPDESPRYEIHIQQCGLNPEQVTEDLNRLHNRRYQPPVEDLRM